MAFIRGVAARKAISVGPFSPDPVRSSVRASLFVSPEARSTPYRVVDVALNIGRISMQARMVRDSSGYTKAYNLELAGRRLGHGITGKPGEVTKPILGTSEFAGWLSRKATVGIVAVAAGLAAWRKKG